MIKDIPSFKMFQAPSESEGVSVLVLAPTRELVLQLAAALGLFLVALGHYPPALLGQSCQQAAAIQQWRGPQLFCGGRLLSAGEV